MSKKSSLLLLIISAFNLLYNFVLPLHPDEAYYWTWSKHLQLSYYDHPPMIAYLIKLSTLFGHSEFLIRLPAVICITLTMWVIYLLARKMFNERVADISLLILLFLPATQAGYLLVTPDAPLIMFWALTVYCIYTALWEDKKSYFYLAGISAGCLLLSKYTGVLLIPSIALFLLTTRFRKVFARKEIYFTLLLAFLLFMPVIIWNAQNEWISFRYQIGHGMGGPQPLKLSGIGEFFAAQALTAGPIFLFALLYYVLRYIKVNLRDEKLAFLLWPLAFTIAFFMYGSLSNRSEANWTVPAYLTGSVLLAYWIDKLNRRWIYYAGIALTVVMVGVMKFPEIFPKLPPNLVMKGKLMGYKEIFLEGSKYTRDPGIVILSDRYQYASEAWYYLPGQPEVHILNPRRMSMYNFWQNDLNRPPLKPAIFFGDEKSVKTLEGLYSHIKLIDVLHFQNRYVTRDMNVYRCAN